MSHQETLSSQVENAARKNNLELFSRLVQKEKNLLATVCEFTGIPLYATVIEEAAQAGNIDILEYLINNGYNINCDIENSTALVFAADENKINTAKWLLDHGAMIDGLSTTITSPLISAITFGHDELATLLIEKGADVNRIHLRLFQTPLDTAYIWKRNSIAEQLKINGAVSTLKPEFTEYSAEQVVRMYVHKNGGPIMPLIFSKAQNAADVTLQFAYFNKNKRLYLFTIGLNSHHEPKIELSIILPLEWSPYNTSPASRFPVELLTCIMNAVVDDSFSISETRFISADDDRFKHLKWPDNIAGFYPVSFNWGNAKDNTKENIEPPNDEDIGPIELLSLMPVKRTKKPVPPADVEKNRTARWGKMTLTI